MLQQLDPFWLYSGFIVFVGFLLALDLGVLNRRAHVITAKEALRWTALWMSLAFAFAGLLYWTDGAEVSQTFITGYFVEQSLSVDNIFVIILILKYFKVAPQYHHKVLFWGIIGAIVMRGVMIALGVALLHQFEWIFYIFGAFLIYTGYNMAFGSEDETDLNDNVVVKYGRKFLRLTPEYHGESFSIVRDGVRYLTPLFLVVMVVEFTDLAFAVDSIPAIFGITTNGFIVFTSNIFAILGLRSLFFAVSGVIDMFHYLKYGLSLVLSFIGVKMIIKQLGWYDMDPTVALLVLVGILGLSVIASLIWKQQSEE